MTKAYWLTVGMFVVLSSSFQALALDETAVGKTRAQEHTYYCQWNHKFTHMFAYLTFWQGRPVRWNNEFWQGVRSFDFMSETPNQYVTITSTTQNTDSKRTKSLRTQSLA